ncbi:hypothetical protein K4A83_11340 [Spirulina subsalsa FACHB-351]|uniref:Uncharacterized protein n=1 Tax=Spirulina subsalsa FACHB-351 TaxID=234711 RepID=A0ABT3L5R5_9CYAN|nr:hypothetical protein [Spirulina subsalsa]MCW6036851.1 hypothetical protein [Spirulina subsalsa FACHB-351]
MGQEFRFILPTPPQTEKFATHQLAYEFRREREQREEWRDYCAWYAETAQKHQAELKKMRRDINLFGWFVRGH